MKAAFYTLGCKLNQSESEALASSFDSRGFSVSKVTESADLYIVNSCTVTTKAEQKARRMIRKFARENPGAVVLVTGCYAQVEPSELFDLGENVFVVSMDRKHTLLNLPDVLMEARSHGLSLIEGISDFLDDSGSRTIDPGDRFLFETSSFSDHTRAFLKIQDGCNNSCAYCRVTIARGDSVSLGYREVVRRALVLEESGFREIVLTGVNITDYRDPGDPDFRLPELVDELVSNLTFTRIRLSSLEPDMIDERLAESVSHTLVVPHFHIPVQSGSDEILKRINRHYSADRVCDAVSLLEGVKKNPFIAADVIAGLPGETEKEFMDTCRLIEKLNFSQLHIFPYSPRPGTALFDAKERVPERITGERTKKLRKLADKLYRRYLDGCSGTLAEVVLEKYITGSGEGQESGKAPTAGININFWSGLSENYLHLKIRGLKGDASFKGRLAECRILSVENSIEAEFIKFV